MEKQRLEFFKTYMSTVCPTGYEEEASRVWCEEASKFADRTWIDLHGNAFAVINEAGSPRIMLAGHADDSDGWPPVAVPDGSAGRGTRRSQNDPQTGRTPTR